MDDTKLEIARSYDRDQTPAPDAPELRDYLAILKRRRWTLIQTVVIVLAITLAVSLLQTPTYESTVRLVLQPTLAGVGDERLKQPDQQELETQREVIVSTAVAQLVTDQLGLSDSPDDLVENVEAQVIGATKVLQVRARSTDPQRAAAVAQAFADSYLEFRRRQNLQGAAAAAASVEARVEEVRRSLEDVQARKAGALGGDLTRLEQEEAALLTQLVDLSGQLALLRLRQNSAGADGEVIRPAQVPAAPSSPNVNRNSILAAVLGTMLGLGLAFVRDSLDDSLHTDSDVVRATGEPVVGRIPRWSQPAGQRLVTLAAPISPAAEAYGMLRINVRFLAAGHSFRSLLVTSAYKRQGKTTTASNLAVAFARAGSRVLVVDADLRRPQLHRTFGQRGGPGLSDVLAGDIDVEDAILDVDIAKLGVLPCGHLPPNQAEPLGSEAMMRLMGQLEQLADLVIYDGPPVLVVADALELATRVGAVLLVIDSTAKPRLGPTLAAAERIRNVGGALLGTVLTNVDPSDTYYVHDETYYVHETYDPRGQPDPEAVAVSAPSGSREPSAGAGDHEDLDVIPDRDVVPASGGDGGQNRVKPRSALRQLTRVRLKSLQRAQQPLQDRSNVDRAPGDPLAWTDVYSRAFERVQAAEKAAYEAHLAERVDKKA